MNVATQSAPTLGILIMTFGMIAILAVPYFLRSSLNKNVGIPSTERRFRFDWRTGARIALLIFWLGCGALGLGRIYSVPTIWMVLSLIVFGLLFIGERRSGREE
jgi:hypothetical protein